MRVAAVVCYRGGAFKGFAPQPGQRTVAGEIRGALETLFRESPPIVGAGRTDAGVHAWGQVLHFDLNKDLNSEELERARASLNGLLRPDVAIRKILQVPPSFHARRSAQARRYLYFLADGSPPECLLPEWVLRVRGELDLKLMNSAALTLYGTHDFSSFCKAEGGSCVRRVEHAVWEQAYLAATSSFKEGFGAPIKRFEIVANAFCRGMVRGIVQAMIEVGRGRMTPADFYSLLKEPDHKRKVGSSPACGLVLHSVRYDGIWW